eukprot:NODE_494_length_7750_cov_0.325317.p1 type:complete len:723 gc:universal NODE_494_length_7750_cov_0.325317:6033-3865(-)
MGVSSLAEILMMNAQFLSITASADMEWPDEWKPYINILKFFSFNFMESFPYFGLNSADSRAQHLLITSMIPIAISAIIILCFRSLITILRYGIIIVCTGGFFLGLIIFVFNKKDPSGTVLMILTGVILILLGIEYFVYKRRHKKAIEEKIKSATGDTVNLDADEIDLEKFKFLKGLKFVHKKSFWRQSRNLILGFFFFGIGTFLFRNIDRNSGNNGNPIFVILGLVGIVMLYNVISNMSVRGRMFNTRMNYGFRKNVVKIILIVMSLLYVPITLSTFRFVFSSNFVEYQKCQNTEVRNMKMPFAPYTGGSNSCFSSYNNTEVQFTDYGLKKSLESELFMKIDKTILYYSEILPYFIPGCVLSIFLITIGMPILYYKLIKTCSKFVQEIPVLAKNPENQWIVRVTASKNCCRSLYAMFQLKWKDYKLISLVYRLLVVSIVSLAGLNKTDRGTSTQVVFVALTGVHLFVFSITCYSRPYISNIEDIVAIVCQGLNVVNAFIAVLFSFKVPVSAKVAGPVIVATTILPFLAIMLGLYLDSRYSKKMSKDLVHHKKKSKAEVEEGPEGDFTKGKVRLAEYLNIEAAELENMDMVIDKKLQDILVYYFIALVLTSTFSAVVGMIAIKNPVYSYNLVNGYSYASRDRASEATLSGNSQFNNENDFSEAQLYYGSPNNYCQNLGVILQNNCSCVDIKNVLVENKREAWRCLSGPLKNSVLVTQTNVDNI